MNVSSKADPENLQLRATPRQLVRFKRGFLIGATALASGSVLGVAMMALRSPAPRLGNPEELYDTGKKATPDGLAALSGDYSQMKLRPPVLGPPLPGGSGASHPRPRSRRSTSLIASRSIRIVTRTTSSANWIFSISATRAASTIRMRCKRRSRPIK